MPGGDRVAELAGGDVAELDRVAPLTANGAVEVGDGLAVGRRHRELREGIARYRSGDAADETSIAAEIPDQQTVRRRVEGGVVGTEGQTSRGAGVPVQLVAPRSGDHVPHDDRALFGARREHRAVVGELDRVDLLRQPFQASLNGERRGVEENDVLKVRHGELRTVGADLEQIGATSMPPISRREESRANRSS